MDNRLNILWGFLAGAAVGSIAGLLFAPEKGSVTRQAIADRSVDFAGDIKTNVRSGIDKFNTWSQSAFSLVNNYGEPETNRPNVEGTL